MPGFPFHVGIPPEFPWSSSGLCPPIPLLDQSLTLLNFGAAGCCPHLTAFLHRVFQGSDSEYEVDPGHQKAHSFVNHYISDPTYYNSWRRQQKGISRAQAYSYTESDSGEPEHTPLSNSTSTQQGSLFRPKASRTPTPQTPGNAPSSQPGTLYRPPSSLAPGSRAPIAGFSSFV